MMHTHKQKPLTDKTGSGSKSTQERRKQPLSVLATVSSFASHIGHLMTRLDHSTPLPDNLPVPFNSGTGFGDPNNLADSRLAAIFTSVCNTTGASISMAGRGGEAFGPAGAKLPVRQPCHVPATPVWRRGAGLTLNLEATMPSISTRISRALFPVFAVPVTTLPTLAEARTLASRLVSQGRRACIQSDAQGFAVSEVKA
ncbi:hypothetical protein NH8B_0510 [Pseudogulbenkiania sp. NH8B]|uniref:hypothetical protein n=1 Tax=Pseudogulbenkiania sp. (strain NH8B) TaxID=748280 RepID=UPI0002279471|nr:hypothetical protein [Pseudogulbenkiania sp. NH8B]BAK75345.1 hypothetical protein NH8B_0510 [Pseudogulbenkiania sp. NH8B]